MVNGTLKHRMRMAVTRIGAISVFALIALWAPATRAALSVGAHSEVINYASCSIDTLGGNINKEPPTGIDDARFQLTANAIAASDGATTVVLLTLDILMMKASHTEAWEAPGPGLDQIAQNISAYAGIPVDNILINSTHTHHAPSTVMIHDYARNTCFCDAVIAAATVAGKMAFDSRVPANLFYGNVVNFGLGQNSRALSSNGWVRFTITNEPWFDSSGPYDPDFTVLQFRDVNAPQRPLATLFTHNVHNSSNFNSNVDKISPDLFGVAAQDLTAVPGNGVNLFFSGASGSSHNFFGPSGSAYTGIIEQLVTDAAQTATLVPNPTISAKRQAFNYEIRNFTETTESTLVDEYMNHFGYPAAFVAGQLTAEHPSDWHRIFADQRSKLLTLLPNGTTHTTVVQAIRIGDVFIVGLPGEVFAQIGLSIKTSSPAPRTIVLGLSNDYVGYLPNLGEYSYTDPNAPSASTLHNFRGGYQTWVGLHSPTAPGTAEGMSATAWWVLTQVGAGIAPPDNLAEYLVPFPGGCPMLTSCPVMHRHLASYVARGDGSFDQYIDNESVYDALSAEQTGTIDTSVTPPLGWYASDAAGRDRGALVDVTGDGRRDYVVVAKTNASQRRFGTYVAQPSGRFSELVPTVDQQGSFIDDGTGRDRGTFVDVTGEGAADYLVVWRGASGQRNIATYVSRFDGTFNQYVNTLDTAGLYVADSTGRDLGEFADVNGDHRADYVVVWKGASGERNLATFCARADGTFAQYVNTLDTHGRFLPDSLGRDMGQFADVNHDGCADYVVVYPDGGNHRVFATFLSNCNGTFAQFVQTPDPNSQFIPDARGRDTGSFADVDGDGRTDYVVVYAGANNQRTFATYRASTTQNGFFQLPFVWTATSDQFNRDSLTGRDMGQFANVTAGDTRADYIVVHPDGNMNRLLTTYSAMADGHFNAGMTTTDRAGRFLGTATQGEYGMFGDIR